MAMMVAEMTGSLAILAPGDGRRRAGVAHRAPNARLADQSARRRRALKKAVEEAP